MPEGKYGANSERAVRAQERHDEAKELDLADEDPEQCQHDPDCEARAWLNGYCGPHQPEKASYR